MLGVYLCQDDSILRPNPVLYRRVNNLPALAVRAPASVHLHHPARRARHERRGRRAAALVLALPAQHGADSRNPRQRRGASSPRARRRSSSTASSTRRIGSKIAIPVTFRVTLSDDAEGEIVLRCESLGEVATPYDWAAWSFVPPR
jgi:hypothetical protein